MFAVSFWIIISSLLPVVVRVNGHTIVRNLRVVGKDLGFLEGIYQPPTTSPLMNLDDPSIACNAGFKRPPAVINVSAGDKVGMVWAHCPGGPCAPGDPEEPIAIGHKGPLTVYMAKDDKGPGDGETGQLNWFKVAHDGLRDGKWGMDRLFESKVQEFEMPTCIPDGQYLIRFEVIAVFDPHKPQFYVGCARIELKGGKGDLPKDTIKFPGGYKANDPGLDLNIYDGTGQPNNQGKEYKIPGPEPIKCGSVAGRIMMKL